MDACFALEDSFCTSPETFFRKKTLIIDAAYLLVSYKPLAHSSAQLLDKGRAAVSAHC